MICKWLGLLSAMALAAPAYARQSFFDQINWSGSVGIASSQVLRGLKMTDDSPVPVFNLTAEHSSGWYLRGGLSQVELAGIVYKATDGVWQTHIDTGYQLKPHPDWSVVLSHHWYRYQEDLQDHSSNYREWGASVNYLAYFTFSYSHSVNLWGRELQQDTATFIGRWPFSQGLIGEAALGWVEQRQRFGEHYPFIRLNLGYLLGDWSLQVQFHSTLGATLPYRRERTGNHWVAQLNWHW